MTLVLNGTTGVSAVDGSAATPAIQGNDSNTGIFFPAADTIAFAEGGAEAMRIDSAGNVGIGTSSPATRLHVAGGSSQVSGSNGIAGIANGNTSGGMKLYAFTAAGTANGYFAIEGYDREYGRFDSSGRLIVGSTTSNGDGSVEGVARTNSTPGVVAGSRTSGDVASAALLVAKFDNNTTTSQVFQRFSINNNGTASGQINANGANAAAFGSWSDRRLKENIVDLASQLDNILALRPVEFDYIESEGGGHQIGFIAQEMQEVYPDAVGDRMPDGMLTVTGWSKTEARLVKAIQEQQALIAALQADVAALKGQA